MAIHDRYVQKESSTIQATEYPNVIYCRISCCSDWSQKFTSAQEFIDKINPDWISLQYVPFSFHNKGIPFSLGIFMKRIRTNALCHIMFHELWVGTNGIKSIKELLWRIMQRRMIRSMIHRIQPDLITAAIRKYQLLLMPTASKCLPLFGNIPVYLKKDSVSQPDFFKVVIFGTLTRDLDDFKKQVEWLNRLAKQVVKKIVFFFIGNNGSQTKEAETIIAQIAGNKACVAVGFVQEEMVSEHLSNAHFGISRADVDYMGKSGTTIAMLEHGLPVLLKGKRPTDSLDTLYQDFYPQFFFTDDPLPLKLPEFSTINLLSGIADQYINLLQQSSKAR
ncbi:MAG: hypothetical protein KGP35_00935 [Bacteroidetes bacterium]|nr:hypothetical protein [Bacteroidota bacterium]